MAAMAALQSSMTSLPLLKLLLGSASFTVHSLFCPEPLLFLLQVKSTEKPCLIVARLKRCERKECKPNSLPVLQKMHVKVGETVKVITGRDKGKFGEITKVFQHNCTVIVSEINLKTKHMKSREEGEPGQIIKIEAPIHSSNVMLYSKEKEVASRVGHKTLDNGKRLRYLIKTGEIIDTPERLKKLKEGKKTEAAAAPAAAS